MSAIISPCKQYRYTLTRDTNLLTPEQSPALFVMLNPSTADASVDDPTIRRCLGFAKQWDCAGLTVVNLYAFRATSPDGLWQVKDPVGPDNDAHLLHQLTEHKDAVCAWGANARQDRVDEFLTIAQKAGTRLWRFELTKSGQPKHPLYMKATQHIVRWYLKVEAQG